MEDHGNKGYRGEERFYNAGKIHPEQSFGRRHFWKIVAVSVISLGLIFASTAVVLLARHSPTPSPNNGSGVVSQSTPTSTPTQAPLAITPTASAPTPTVPVTPTSIVGLPCTVDMSTWTDGSSDWKVLNGVLLDDGTNGSAPYDSGFDPTIVAPCSLGNTTNYAVETKIQVVSGTEGCFGITVRGNPLSSGWQGYEAGIGGCGYHDLSTAYLTGPTYTNDSAGIQASFAPGTHVHTYRVEVKDNTIKFFVDGSLLLTLTDNRYLIGSQVGLWDQNIQLQVTSFQVTALS